MLASRKAQQARMILVVGALGVLLLALGVGGRAAPAPEDPAKDSKPLLTFGEFKQRVLSVAWSPDGKRLAVAQDFPEPAGVYDAATGKELLALPPAYGAAWSPDGKKLALATSAGDQIRDATTGKPVLSLGKIPESSWRVVFSPDGRLIALGGLGYRKGEKIERRGPNGDIIQTKYREVPIVVVRIFETECGKYLRAFEVLVRGGVAGLTFSADSARVATVGASADRTVKVWNVKDGEEAFTIQGRYEWGKFSETASDVVFSPDGKWLAVGMENSGSDPEGNTIPVWTAVTGKAAFRLPGHRRTIRSSALIRCLAFSPDAMLLASGSNDGTVKVWDMEARKLLVTFAGQEGTNFWAVAFSPDGKPLATGSSGEGGTGKVTLWDVTKHLASATNEK